MTNKKSVVSSDGGIKMVRLTKDQLNTKADFIKDYMGDSNAATSSKFDANANVSKKNIATLSAEINKDINIQINRHLLESKIKDIFGQATSDEYIRQLESHEIYAHDETGLTPYCVSITMYPFLLDGLTGLGGESKAPKHCDSFAGSFVNLVFAVSSQFSGAVATPEWLMMLDYFCRSDYGDNYLQTHQKRIENHLQHMVYALNQPAAARGYQSAFWNIAIFDEYYFNGLFDNFVYPDGSRPKWETINKLQTFFMKWFNKERTRALLTFPVVTAAMLLDDKTHTPKDVYFADMLAQEMSEGNSFFIYTSENVDSLSSCCRLRNELADNTFSFTLGAGGIATGSINVITLNMSRLVQNACNKEPQGAGKDINKIKKHLLEEVEKIHKYQAAYRVLMEEFLRQKLLTVYEAGFIGLDKQFLTLGVNGLVEAAEYCGLEPSNNPEYIDFVSQLLKVIYDANKVGKATYGYKFNTEMVPAENLGVKNARWDRKDGYFVPRDCYNSYFYAVEDHDTNVIDKFVLHGRQVVQYLDGGSALHLNTAQYLTKKQYLQLFNIAGQCGTNYFTSNTLVTVCNTCGHIDKNTRTECSQCQSKDIDYATRVIGYLKKISSFSIDRQKEAAKRHYHGMDIQDENKTRANTVKDAA